jgi:putative ABC transport system permease protein
MAVGADAGAVRRLVLGQALRLVAIGGAVGLAGAVAAGGLVESLLFGVTARDWPSFATAIAALSVAALAAAWWPARRASRLNPVAAIGLSGRA